MAININHDEETITSDGGNLYIDGMAISSQIYLGSDPDTDLSIGDGQLYVTIPQHLDGKDLKSAHAIVYTTSSSGLPTIQIHNVTDAVDILSTRITIDVGELNSYTALTQPAINTSNDTVARGDVIRIDVDVAGTGTKGLDVILTFG